MHRVTFLCCTLLFSLSVVCNSKQSPIDSLKSFVAKASSDTNKVKALIDLSNAYRADSQADALQYAMQAKTLAEELAYPWGIGYALKAIGMVHFLQTHHVEALQAFRAALKVFIEHGIKVGEANMLNNIGTIYFTKSLETEALDFYLRSLKKSEEIHDTLRIATALVNIGSVYSNKAATYDKAVHYHNLGLTLGFAIKDSLLIANSLANIGEIFYKWESYDSALYHLRRALYFDPDSAQRSYALNIIGRVFQKKNQLDSAIAYHQQAYVVAKNVGAVLEMAQALLGKADAKKEKGDCNGAVETYREAELLFNDIGFEQTFDLELVYKGMTACYEALGDLKSSHYSLHKLVDVKEKIYDLEVDKKLGTQIFEYEIKKKQGEVDSKVEEISQQKLIQTGLIGGMVVLLLFAVIFFRQRNRIRKEKHRSDELLLNILPAETAEELKATGTAKAKRIDSASVMFTDFRNFTQASETLSPEQLVHEINFCYSEFDRIITKHGIEKIKTIGDSYMCAGGLPIPNDTHASDVVAAALEIAQFIEQNKVEKSKLGAPFFEARIGIHTGPVVAGIVGIKKFAYDIWGDTVNTALRMETSGEIGKVNISGATYALVKDAFVCTHRGKIEAKNKGEVDMYFVEFRI